MFYRLETDGARQEVQLKNFYSGSNSSACWIIGGGVSLRELPIDLIRNSPLPKFGMNLAGSGLLRPNFWTSYDPTARFHRSIYLDPSIVNFLHRSRAMDLVPESTAKVCDCPATLFFDRSRENSFQDFLQPQENLLPDWQDSFLQTIQIAYQLGFRRLYLAGCEMFISPTEQQLQLAEKHDVHYEKNELLKSFVERCYQAGIKKSELESINSGAQYHFDESKELGATIQTDFHYFRVAQYLRLARKALALSGLQIVSVTPSSRLNDYFRYQSIETTVSEIQSDIGDPVLESTRGLYTGKLDRTPLALGPMRDFKPHFTAPKEQLVRPQPDPRKVIDLPEVPVYLNENP
ncbi:MAG: hypothetical protein HON04_07455 [Planctomicrobium sp.]|nr:hypothetical protein [Planctomicrobium sp.]